jgi:predicted O-methyltransferase YrrM
VKTTSHSAQAKRLLVRRLINPILERGSRWLLPTPWLQGREIVYQNLVHRELDRLGIDTPFYAIRSAATFSYLYLLLRLTEDFNDLRVLELGAGQSTLLLDRLRATRPLTLTTLEDNADWAARIGGQVESTMLHAPLQARQFAGHRFDGYDPGVLDGRSQFNLLLIDGPRRSRKRSRWTGLEFLETVLDQDFVVIFDDAERRGELQTIAQALKLLDARGVRYGVQLTRSVNSQFLIATPGFEAALYY